MNERIFELIQAQNGFSGPVWTEEDKQEFAKMIVVKCADICNKIYFERYPDAEHFERSEEGDAIKKYFGVEE